MRWHETHWFCWIVMGAVTIISGVYFDKTSEQIADAVYFMGTGLFYHWWVNGGFEWLLSIIHRATAPTEGHK